MGFFPNLPEAAETVIFSIAAASSSRCATGVTRRASPGIFWIVYGFVRGDFLSDLYFAPSQYKHFKTTFDAFTLQIFNRHMRKGNKNHTCSLIDLTFCVNIVYLKSRLRKMRACLKVEENAVSAIRDGSS
ncbi:hypothetical protein AVEN_236147-1 [Araneus ventricosus]|uniref:Uncharacterized protein n=1 Tax=Araneus ventricosus TaxID=182803 RepID=A0A4Y2HUV5_ARAVE|nr:hypothetical protein AVEN_236147-1 [Araneus ventricosus]